MLAGAMTKGRPGRAVPVETPLESGTLQSIRTLRAAAALLVVVFHVLEKAGGSFKTGAAGVDLFFVISGFIMWVTTVRRRVSPLTFLGHRVIRILPLYWGVTLVMASVALVAPSLLQNRSLDPARLVASLLFIPHHDHTGMPWPLFVPGWTLNYEMFFYAVFAAILLLRRPAQIWVATGLLLTLTVLGLLLRPRCPVAATYTSPLLLEFLAGLWLGQAYTRCRLPGRAAGSAMLLAGIGMLVALELAHYDADAWRPVLWGGPAFLIVAGAMAREASGSHLRPALLGHLGDASYSLYLTHPLTIPVIWTMLPEQAMPMRAAVAVAVSCVIGMLCFILLERPATRALRSAVAPALRSAKPGASAFSSKGPLRL